MSTIKSLDYVSKTLYNSKFNKWLNNINIKVVLDNDNWELKSNDFNIQIALTDDKKGGYFIKCKFSIGLIYFKSPKEITDILESINYYSNKPDLVGFIFTRPISNEGDLFLNISYMFNIFEEMNLCDYLNLLYDQVEEIKQDFNYKLGINLLSYNNLEDNTDDQEEEEEYDEDDLIEDEDIISPYDLGDR